MPGRLIHKVDFERLMSAPTWSRSAHFALHHLSRGPAVAARPSRQPARAEISTDLPPASDKAVDNVPDQVWAAAVVPKRHARRAVTRNLLKRQIRQAFARHESGLPHGLWLVRLRRVFAPAEFVSARSELLAEAVRRELEELLRRARPGRVG
jgi:ribonuclease P protein component